MLTLQDVSDKLDDVARALTRQSATLTALSDAPVAAGPDAALLVDLHTLRVDALACAARSRRERAAFEAIAAGLERMLVGAAAPSAPPLRAPGSTAGRWRPPRWSTRRTRRPTAPSSPCASRVCPPPVAASARPGSRCTVAVSTAWPRVHLVRPVPDGVQPRRVGLFPRTPTVQSVRRRPDAVHSRHRNPVAAPSSAGAVRPCQPGIVGIGLITHLVVDGLIPLPATFGQLYPIGTSAERVTVSLPADVLHEAKSRVAAGEAESLSAFVAGALRTTMSRTRALVELERVGRRPSAEVLAAVRRDLGLGPITDRVDDRATA